MANVAKRLFGRPALNALERDGACGAGLGLGRSDPRWRRLVEARAREAVERAETIAAALRIARAVAAM